MAKFMEDVIPCAQAHGGHLWGEPFHDPPPGTEVLGIPITPQWAVECEGSRGGCGVKAVGHTPDQARQEAAAFDQANLAGHFG